MSYQSVIDTKSPVWHLRLGETVGSGTVTDRIASKVGTVGSGVTLGTAGLADAADTAATFNNNVNATIDFGGAMNVHNITKGTVVLWRTVSQNGGGSPTEYVIASRRVAVLDTNFSISFSDDGAGNHYTKQLGSGIWGPGKHCFIFTFDWTLGAGACVIKFYVDGVLLGTTSNGTDPGSDNSFKLGSVSQPVNGVIDEISIHSLLFAQQDVTDVFNAGTGLVAGALNNPSSITTSGMTLTWAAAINGTGTVTYTLKRGLSSGAINTTVFTGTGLTFADTGLTTNTQYFYQVTAVDQSSPTPQTAVSNIVNGTTLLGPTGTLTVASRTPYGVSLTTVLGGSAIKVQLQKAPDVAGSPGAYSNIGPNDFRLRYLDTASIVPSTPYWYRGVVSDGSTTANTNAVNPTTLAVPAIAVLTYADRLAAAQAKQVGNTTQWQDFLANRINNINQGLDHVTEEFYHVGELGEYCFAFAVAYQLTKASNATLAARYADKAIGLLQTIRNTYADNTMATAKFLARGDGVTTTFTLPDADFVPGTLVVWSVPVFVQIQVKGSETAYASDIPLKISNTSDGSVDYVQGTGNSWWSNPDLPSGIVDWSPATVSAAAKPSNAATYYVTSASIFKQDGSGSNPKSTLNVDYTVNAGAHTITFAVAPATSRAVLVEYQYGTFTSGATTLGYQQTMGMVGGYNNVFIDAGYTSRSLRFAIYALDWLRGYAGLSGMLQHQVMDDAIRWTDYLAASGYKINIPESNYSDGHYNQRMGTAVALVGWCSEAGRLASAIQTWRNTYVVPVLAAGNATVKGGSWPEGWSYGLNAVKNLMTATLDGGQSGVLASIAAEQAWAAEAAQAIIHGQTIVNSLDSYGDFSSFSGWPVIPAASAGQQACMAMLAAAMTDVTIRAYANFYAQATVTDYSAVDLLFRDPAATATNWTGALPLSYYASGMGHAVARKDWTYASTWFATQFGNPLGCDHQSFNAGNIEIFKGNKVLNPNPYIIGERYPDMSHYSNLVVIDTGSGATQRNPFSQDIAGVYNPLVTSRWEGVSGYVYHDGDVHGAYFFSAQNPVSKLFRSVLYDRAADKIFIHDRATTTLAATVKELLFYSPTAPTISGNGWTITNGTAREFGKAFSDVALTTTSADTGLGGGGQAFHITTVNTVNTAGLRYRTALQITSNATGAMDTTVDIPTTDAVCEGVQCGDSLAIFGSAADIAGAASYNFTGASGHTINHYACGLQASVNYTVTVGGGAPQTVASSAKGVLNFTSTGTGSQQTVSITPPGPATSYTATPDVTTVGVGGTVTITITPNGTATGNISGSVSGGGSINGPAVFSSSAAPQTLTFTAPGTPGTSTITWSNTASIANPGNTVITVTSADSTAPTVPTGLAATPGDQQVALAWGISTDPDDAVASYKVYRDGVLRTTITAPTHAFTDTSLTNGQAYSYRVSAVDAHGNESAQCGAVSATPNVAVPAAPGGLTAVPGHGSVALSWSAAANATTYKIYRSTSAGAETLYASGIGTTAYTDNAVGDGTAYYYKVAGVNGSGVGAQSAEVSTVVLRLATPVLTVFAPTISRSVPLGWAAVSGAVSYDIYRDGVKLNGSPLLVLSYTDTTDAGPHAYLVAAVDAGGQTLSATAILPAVGSGSVGGTGIPAPQITPAAEAGGASRSFSGLVQVSIAGPIGALVYYTMDGSDPRTVGKVYGSPFTLNHSTQVRAIAKVNGVFGAEASVTYAKKVRQA